MVAHIEDGIQKACIDLLAIAERQGRLTYLHVPNGARLTNAKRQGGRMKALGVRAGVPDLIIVWPNGRTVWIELKAPKGVLSPSQKEWRDRLQALGHEWHLFRDHLAMNTWLNSRLA